MAKKETSKPGNNGYDPDKTLAYVEGIEAEDRKIASIMSKAMTDCKKPNARKKDILSDAKLDGIPKMELKAVVKTRAFQRKVDKLREDMEPENQDEFDKLLQAIDGLLDTPLGQAAVDAAS